MASMIPSLRWSCLCVAANELGSPPSLVCGLCPHGHCLITLKWSTAPHSRWEERRDFISCVCPFYPGKQFFFPEAPSDMVTHIVGKPPKVSVCPLKKKKIICNRKRAREKEVRNGQVSWSVSQRVSEAQMLAQEGASEMGWCSPREVTACLKSQIKWQCPPRLERGINWLLPCFTRVTRHLRKTPLNRIAWKPRVSKQICSFFLNSYVVF